MSKKKKKHHNYSYKYLVCPIKKAGIKEINYKDVEFLKQFLTENGKILPRRVSNVCAKNQRLLATAIKKARLLSLLTFIGENYPRDDSIVQQQIKPTAETSPINEDNTEKSTENNSEEKAQDTVEEASQKVTSDSTEN